MSDELKNAILADLAAVQRLYDREFEPMAARTEMADDLDRWRRDVHGAIERTRQAVEAVTSLDDPAARTHTARDAVLSVGSLDAQFTSIAAQINISQTAGHVSYAIGSTLTSLINNIKAVVQGISAQILQLISNLVTPSGWAVAGGLGANLFGLQGNVQIEIQFT